MNDNSSEDSDSENLKLKNELTDEPNPDGLVSVKVIRQDDEDGHPIYQVSLIFYSSVNLNQSMD